MLLVEASQRAQHCTGLTAFDELGCGLAGLASLTQLWLNFGYRSCLASVDELGRDLAGLASLTQLNLNSMCCA